MLRLRRRQVRHATPRIICVFIIVFFVVLLELESIVGLFGLPARFSPFGRILNDVGIMAGVLGVVGDDTRSIEEQLAALNIAVHHGAFRVVVVPSLLLALFLHSSTISSASLARLLGTVPELILIVGLFC
jgi:hypothetical protein